MACQPRYVDNGDGTVTDYKMGLMWEKKTGTVGTANTSDVHDVNNVYTYTNYVTASAPLYADPTGTLFTDFLMNLNGQIVLNSSGITNLCFAGYCDWRIPSAGELRSILNVSNCPASACIDPVFGPTRSYYYWTTSLRSPGENFVVWFNIGLVDTWPGSNNEATSARAARTVR